MSTVEDIAGFHDGSERFDSSVTSHTIVANSLNV
jgi:hypothetical protein